MLNLKLITVSVGLAAALSFSGCVTNLENMETTKKMEMTKTSPLLAGYAKIAQANYTDALNGAKALQMAIEEFSSTPNEKTFSNAKIAWLNSRESYGQTEIFRLANGPIDAEEGWVADIYGSLEGQLNAWPLDENMIDYTIDANGKRTSGNIIDTVGSFNPGGEDASAVNVSNITVDAITALNENGGDANVATGYHAIEFLLWGQDQDYSNFVKDSITNGAKTAGQRPLSDYVSDSNAPRRIAFLKAASAKIVSDLQTVASAWSENGLYKNAFLGKLSGDDASKNISSSDALKQVIAGMGVFMKSELANERIAVAVLTPSEEDEHSCFSDNTHRDITTNYLGFRNVLTSTYKNESYGKSMLDALPMEDQKRIISLMKSIETKIASVNKVAMTSAHFDYQIQADNPQSKVIVKLKNEMRKLGDEMVNVANANGISLTQEDVTDADETKI
ncbi:imelysin family protein [Poseidonibacter ostreae]|jgi:putative iron-regulated protein|uniref:Imelysin n=1 Tax=Poseidonibacter ostreae TaxID=2654171 RepID=A0A6L4WRV1_9BACT|nr:imelysin family protein [Poseidonibacter ostreae]KAB7886141.1 imelysin [Poseidonibacter ostreae]KAB7887810.1 imelysin [Poseidonibacter ostreae]KAB7888557.1 imelysin [Poseidonibacter ostreae]